MKNTWNAKNKYEMPDLIRSVNMEVPLRTEGRKKDHTERYSMARLLATLPAERMHFPLQLGHSDRPDFVLSMAGNLIGIEHTEVVPENIAHADFLREKGHGPETYFTPRAIPGESKKTHHKLRDEITADIPGFGWCGESAEREWAAAMLHSIQAKMIKVQADGFTRHKKNWLLMYDNWPGPALNLPKAVSFLEPLLAVEKAFSVFDTIFIMDDHELCEIKICTSFIISPLRRELTNQ